MHRFGHVPFRKPVGLVPFSPYACLWLGCLVVQATAQDAAQEPAQPQVQEVQAAIPLIPVQRFERVQRLPAAALQPARGLYHLDNLVLAKAVQQEGTKLIFLVEQYRTEEREVTVMRVREEERSRTVTVVRDGEEVEVDQVFTVQVPFQQKVTRPVKVPAGKKPKTVDWDKLRAYRLDGTRLEEEQIGEILSSTRPVFLVSGIDRACEPASDLVRQAMQPDTVIVFTDAFGALPKP